MDFGHADARVSVAFLVACGVAHGLPVIAAPRLKLRGEDVNARRAPGWVTVRGLNSGERSTWLEAAKNRATGTVSYVTTEYTSDPLILLTAQREYGLLNEQQRLSFASLVITSMATWPATTMRTVFRRDTDYASSTWPSPAAAFLMDTEWFPQRVPGERGKVEFRRPGDSWWVGRDAPRPFCHRNPRGSPIRRHLRRSLS